MDFKVMFFCGYCPTPDPPIHQSVEFSTLFFNPSLINHTKIRSCINWHFIGSFTIREAPISSPLPSVEYALISQPIHAEPLREILCFTLDWLLSVQCSILVLNKYSIGQSQQLHSNIVGIGPIKEDEVGLSRQ